MVACVDHHVDRRLLDAENAHWLSTHISAISRVVDTGDGHRRRIVRPVPMRVGMEEHPNNFSRRD